MVMASGTYAGHFLSSDGERKSRFMKWLGKIFKSGSDREVTDRHYPQYVGEENMVWRAPARSLVTRPGPYCSVSISFIVIMMSLITYKFRVSLGSRGGKLI